jgi:hypothetical protein
LVKITDDDADGIISTQRLKKERRYSLDRCFARVVANWRIEFTASARVASIAYRKPLADARGSDQSHDREGVV